MSLEQPVPKTVAICPHCGGQLHMEVDEWYEDGTPSETGVHVSCEHENDDPDTARQHMYMPYVYWLPLRMTVYQWVIDTGLKVPRYTKEEEVLRLKAWNEGKPL